MIGLHEIALSTLVRHVYVLGVVCEPTQPDLLWDLFATELAIIYLFYYNFFLNILAFKIATIVVKIL